MFQKLNRASFPRIRHSITGRETLVIDYEVRISFDYPRLTYEIIIPSSGKFPATGKGWGPNPIREPATVNCAALLELVGQGVDQKPTPASHIVRSPSPDGSSLPISQTNHPETQSPSQGGGSRPLPLPTPQGELGMPRRNKRIPASHSRNPYPTPRAVNTNVDSVKKQQQSCQLCRKRGVECIRASPTKRCFRCIKQHQICKS